MALVKIAWETVMLDKTNGMLDILERIIKLFKPKFHNKITKIIIFFGFTLCVESQFNLIETFLVALYETNFGKSDYLRTVFESRANPWVGLTLIVFGLVYSAVTTLGLDLISKIKAAMPKTPSFELYIYNCDDDKIDPDYNFRGILCSATMREIPDNESYSERYQNEIDAKKSSQSLYPRSLLDQWNQPIVNNDLYRERADFLKTWGGSDIFSLGIKNTGDILAKNVRVRLLLEKKQSNRVKIGNEFIPTTPEWEKENPNLLRLSGMRYNVPEKYDIQQLKNEIDYIFEWDIGNLQAKSDEYSNSKIFIRIEEVTFLNVNIYCDELSDPISIKYKLLPTNNCQDLNLKTLMLNDVDFLKESDKMIMDGFITRFFTKLSKENNYSDSLNSII